MKTLLTAFLILSSFNLFADCASTKKDEGLRYCADVEFIDEDTILLTKPLLVSLYYNDGGTAFKASKKNKICRAFSREYKRNFKYVQNSLVIGYSRTTTVNNNEQARLYDEAVEVIYSIECKAN